MDYMNTNLSKRIEDVNTNLNHRMDGLEKRVDGVETQVTQRIAGIEARLTNRVSIWVTIVVAAATALVGFFMNHVRF
jgi:tetrahydromethanopterin S-methyltransferase subunit G